MMMRTIGPLISALLFLIVALIYLIAGNGHNTLGVLLSGALFIFCVFLAWRSFQQQKRG